MVAIKRSNTILPWSITVTYSFLYPQVLLPMLGPKFASNFCFLEKETGTKLHCRTAHLTRSVYRNRVNEWQQTDFKQREQMKQSSI